MVTRNWTAKVVPVDPSHIGSSTDREYERWHQRGALGSGAVDGGRNARQMKLLPVRHPRSACKPPGHGARGIPSQRSPKPGNHMDTVVGQDSRIIHWINLAMLIKFSLSQNWRQGVPCSTQKNQRFFSVLNLESLFVFFPHCSYCSLPYWTTNCEGGMAATSTSLTLDGWNIHYRSIFTNHPSLPWIVCVFPSNNHVSYGSSIMALSCYVLAILINATQLDPNYQ